MRVRIEGARSGEVFGTSVVNVETGEALQDVRSVTWRHVAGEPPVAIVEIVLSELAPTEIEAEVREVPP